MPELFDLLEDFAERVKTVFMKHKTEMAIAAAIGFILGAIIF